MARLPLAHILLLKRNVLLCLPSLFIHHRLLTKVSYTPRRDLAGGQGVFGHHEGVVIPPEMQQYMASIESHHEISHPSKDDQSTTKQATVLSSSHQSNFMQYNFATFYSLWGLILQQIGR